MAKPASIRMCIALTAIFFCCPLWAQQAASSPNDAAVRLGDSMEFTDRPHFTVAGVTDWTAAGGHGADTTLRTSEFLANATASLASSKPGDRLTSAASPGTKSAATAQRVAAEREEAAGDSLQAVRDFQQAATLEASEENTFEWGAELLLHRAIWQAEEVFRKGAAAYPASLRMQTGLASALFAGARYEDAARHLCAASDLSPDNAEPYLLLGRIQIAAAGSLPCAEAGLARFAKLQPGSATARYLYAMAILKGSQTAATLQRATQLLLQAVTLDSKCGEAYLQLGAMAAARHDYEEAIRYDRQAIAADPTLAEAHYRLGVAYDRAGNAVEARKEFALHESLKQEQAAAVEAQRKSVKQFLFTQGTAQP